MTISTRNRTAVRSLVVLGCLCAALLAAFGCGGAAKSTAEEASAEAPAGDGSPGTAETENPATEADSMIAFASDRDGDFDIYLMNVSGTGLQQLTRNDADDFEPTWSPDGQKLAFTSTRSEFAEDIYVMNADGTDQRRLTPQPGRDYEPAWSPDGRRIAFTSSRDGAREIYVMNADGTGQGRVTGDLGSYGGRPAWSPDGQRITFQADGTSEGNDGGIYVINADGSEQHRLAEIPHVWHCGPVLSPDGRRIAFGGVVGGTSAYLYVGNADGSRPKQLAQFTSSPDACMDASWSPDGRTIAYWSELDGLPDIQVIGVDGTGLRRLTHDPASDVDAAWQPAPAPSRG